MNRINKNHFTSGVMWKVFDLVFSKSLNTIVSIILARQLAPSNYGLMTIWAVILSFGNQVVIGGTDTILIQSSDEESDNWYICLLGNLFKAIILYLVLFAISSRIAGFYSEEFLKILIRIAGLNFLSQAIIATCVARAMKMLDIKSICLADLAGTVAGVVSSLLLLGSGFGHFALVSNIIVKEFVYALYLLISERKILSSQFSLKKYFELSRLGIKVFANSLFDVVVSTSNGLFSGKKWPSIEVGYLNRAEKFTQTIGLNSYNVVSGLLLPTFSSYQNDREKLKLVFRHMTMATCYLMFPLMLGVAIFCEELVCLILTEKWLPSVPLIRTLCVVYAINPLRQLGMQINYSVGQFQENVKIEGIRTILSIFVLIILYFIQDISIFVMPLSACIVSIVNVICYIFSLREAVNYSITELIQDIFPIVLISVISIIPVLIIKEYLLLPIIPFLVISSAFSVFVYIGFSIFFKLKIFSYLKLSILNFIKRR